MGWSKFIILFIIGLKTNGNDAVTKNREKGVYLGPIQGLEHGVRGQVWALDDKTLYIESFTYDGVGPDAFFWVGNSSQPQPSGQLLRYPLTDTYGRKAIKLNAFRGENVILHLPPGTKVTDITYLSVWCRRFTVNFGHVLFPPIGELPRKRVLNEFKRLAHNVRSGNVTILDARTFYIPNLHYDGQGPDAFFWVGKGSSPDHLGTKIPNEKGSYDVLRRYEGEDIEIQLPENKTIYDIDYLSIWCIQYRHNFGHVQIPSADSMWLPPSLGQIRIKPEDLAKAYGEEPVYDEDTIDFVPESTVPEVEEEEEKGTYLPRPISEDDKKVSYLPTEEEVQDIAKDKSTQASFDLPNADAASSTLTESLIIILSLYSLNLLF